MKTADIEDFGSAVLVKIPNTKTKTARKFATSGRLYDIFKPHVLLKIT